MIYVHKCNGVYIICLCCMGLRLKLGFNKTLRLIGIISLCNHRFTNHRAFLFKLKIGYTAFVPCLSASQRRASPGPLVSPVGTPRDGESFIHDRSARENFSSYTPLMPRSNDGAAWVQGLWVGGQGPLADPVCWVAVKNSSLV